MLKQQQQQAACHHVQNRFNKKNSEQIKNGLPIRNFNGNDIRIPLYIPALDLIIDRLRDRQRQMS